MYLTRTLNEMKNLMRLDDIIMHSTQKVAKKFLALNYILYFSNLFSSSCHFQIEIMEFTSEDKEKIEPVAKNP